MMMIMIIIIRVFCPRAGLLLQTHEPRQQFYPSLEYSAQWQVFHCKPRNQCSSFIRDWIGGVASHCFPQPTLSLTSEQTLKDPRGTNMVVRRVDLANWTLRTSPKFTTGVKYRFQQGAWPDQRSGNPNHPSPPDIIKNHKSRRLRWAGHVALIQESGNAFCVLLGKLEGKRHLESARRRR